MLNKVIGKNLKALRYKQKVLFRGKMRRVSQERIAQVLGIHQSALCRVEKGNQELSAVQLHNAAKFFNVDMTVFFE